MSASRSPAGGGCGSAGGGSPTVWGARSTTHDARRAFDIGYEPPLGLDRPFAPPALRAAPGLAAQARPDTGAPRSVTVSPGTLQHVALRALEAAALDIARIADALGRRDANAESVAYELSRKGLIGRAPGRADAWIITAAGRQELARLRAVRRGPPPAEGRAVTSAGKPLPLRVLDGSMEWMALREVAAGVAGSKAMAAAVQRMPAHAHQLVGVLKAKGFVAGASGSWTVTAEGVAELERLRLAREAGR